VNQYQPATATAVNYAGSVNIRSMPQVSLVSVSHNNLHARICSARAFQTFMRQCTLLSFFSILVRPIIVQGKSFDYEETFHQQRAIK
jgi:hypothetical protein